MAVKAYEGNQPYIFVSYAHKDSEAVMPILSALQGMGFRIWYDAGIEAGTEWPEYIAEHLNAATRVLAFTSKNFVASQNCRREINFAIDLKKDPLVVYLEEFELSLGMRMQLGTLQGIMYYRHPSFESFIEALTKVKELSLCRDAVGDRTEYVDTVPPRVPPRTDGAKGSVRRIELLEARIQKAAYLNQKSEAARDLQAALRQKEAERAKRGEPSRVIRASIALLLAAVINFISFVSLVSETGGVGAWLATGVLYYIVSLVQIKSTKKGFGWLFLNIPTLGCFGWIHAIISMATVGKSTRLAREVDDIRQRLHRVTQDIRRGEAELQEINRELETLS